MLKYFAISGLAILGVGTADARQPAAPEPFVQFAELDIDPAQLDAFKAHLTEEVETSVGREPGVLMLYAVSIDSDPTHVRLVEVYASAAAYEAHRRSPQFLKYKSSTAGMVRALSLAPASPVKMCAKAAMSPQSKVHCL